MQQSLELRATQQLTLSPQIVQAIRILQLSAADLEHEVEEALANNPFLERPESTSGASSTSTTSTTAADEEPVEAAPLATAAADVDDDREDHDPWTSRSPKRTDDERPIGEGYAPSTTLRDSLMALLSLAGFTGSARRRPDAAPGRNSAPTDRPRRHRRRLRMRGAAPPDPRSPASTGRPARL